MLFSHLDPMIKMFWKNWILGLSYICKACAAVWNPILFTLVSTATWRGVVKTTRGNGTVRLVHVMDDQVLPTREGPSPEGSFVDPTIRL